MDKVYIVVSGEYSDYGIDAVFDNLKSAEMYCALHNDDAYDDCRIEEYQVNGDTYQGTMEYGYAYELHGSTRRPNINGLEETIMTKQNFEKRVKEYLGYSWARPTGREKVPITWMSERNPEKALKIIQDIIAYNKALSEEIV